MIDMHTHILHGLDDGPMTLEDSVEMARMAVSNGISTVFATPHHRTSRYFTSPEEIEAAIKKLSEALAEKRIPLDVRGGQEIRITRSLIDDWYDGGLLTLGGTRYVLIECPSHEIPDDLAEICHELSILGKVPVIAHPERNRAVAEDPDKLLELMEWGAVFQMTADSLLGTFGPRVETLAHDLCSRRLIHLLASDAHDRVRRPFRLREAYSRIEERIDGDFAEYCRSNARLLAEDAPLQHGEPVASKPRGLFAIFR
ncbi:tyrosine-protein phosphatase [Paenibacillus sp. FJAT-26967]|uniref:tyrosine-protein phosphatase n=1 Tax=Paenibacillus sp. FJAT-26967 TaxID=1729690 RepID=UPI000839A3BC|nr:CpsB/CapC family capsule biosynthesis tyrosine phosphatase [Paenibacillus sp. FJAT-26967]